MTTALSPTYQETVSPERFLQGYRWILLARTLEEKISSLYQSGKIVGGVYLGKGQEAFSASLALALEKGKDVFAPLIRDQAGRMAFGEAMVDTVRTYLGCVLGPMRGRDGNIHRGRPKDGMPAMISHLGSMISVVCGMLMARRFRGETAIVGATCIGDGGTSTGAFHEAMNLAGVERLPLVVAVANNQFAYSTPNARQYACEHLVDKAVGYGFTGHVVDGTNLQACLEVFAHAVETARRECRPQMVVGNLMRLCGHGEHDDASYVPPNMKAGAVDCVLAAREQAILNGWATPAELDSLYSELHASVQEIVAKVQREPVPDPRNETWEPLASRWLIESR